VKTRIAKLPTLTDLTALFVSLKKDIGDEYRTECQEDDIPTMDVTIGWCDKSGDWSYQTGDNSFTGGAYGYPHWAVVCLQRRSNSRELARYVQSQLDECTW
jgi:hypothetical protein